jgi:hypothetical protein
MIRVTKIVAVPIIVIALCLAVTDPTWAQNRERRSRMITPPRSAGYYATRTPASFRTYSPYESWRYGYPKYEGGFHARYHLETMYPTGDRPVRGTAW